MENKKMNLQELIEQSHKTAKEKGFWDKEKNIVVKIALIITELCEGIEAHRKGKFGLEKKDFFEDEIADAFIRLFDLCGYMKIDIEKQLKWKMAYNLTRPKLHGKKY